jgi:hypothetical protein
MAHILRKPNLNSTNFSHLVMLECEKSNEDVMISIISVVHFNVL